MDNEKVIERIATLESSVKSAHKRLDDISCLTKSVYTLATEVKNMREDVNKIDDRLTAFEKAPKDRLNQIITAIISAIAGGTISFAIAQLFR